MTLTDENRPFIRMLLPFWVNGSLRGYDATVVQSSLGSDPQLRAEADLLAMLRESMGSMTSDVSPGEFGLARLQKEIAAEMKPAPRPFSTFAVAAAVMMTVLGTLYLSVPSFQHEAAFRQASGPDPSGTLVVRFRDGTSESALRRILLDNGLVIVDGPSALGFYHVQVSPDASVEAIVAVLQSQDDVIGTVEPAE